MQTFCGSIQNRGKIILFLRFFLWNSLLQSCLWLIQSKFFFIFCLFLRLASFCGGLRFTHFGATEKDLGYPGDSGIAVQSYTGTQMRIGWTLGSQSIAQTSTNKLEPLFGHLMCHVHYY